MDLGRVVGYSERCSAFGAKSKRVTNVFIVDFKDLLDLQDKEEVLKLEALFKQAIQVFQPYWGCVLSSLSSDKLREMNIQSYKNLVHWMNYYDENFVQEIGEERIRDFLKEFPSASYEEGILKLKDSALDLTQTEDILLHEHATKFLMKKFI